MSKLKAFFFFWLFPQVNCEQKRGLESSKKLRLNDKALFSAKTRRAIKFAATYCRQFTRCHAKPLEEHSLIKQATSAKRVKELTFHIYVNFISRFQLHHGNINNFFPSNFFLIFSQLRYSFHVLLIFCFSCLV